MAGPAISLVCCLVIRSELHTLVSPHHGPAQYLEVVFLRLIYLDQLLQRFFPFLAIFNQPVLIGQRVRAILNENILPVGPG
jgi:hypothetical protein